MVLKRSYIREPKLIPLISLLLPSILGTCSKPESRLNFLTNVSYNVTHYGFVSSLYTRYRVPSYTLYLSLFRLCLPCYKLGTPGPPSLLPSCQMSLPSDVFRTSPR